MAHWMPAAWPRSIGCHDCLCGTPAVPLVIQCPLTGAVDGPIASLTLWLLLQNKQVTGAPLGHIDGGVVDPLPWAGQ